jgi:putative LysE/RhtB family amino acid efflux pump
MGYVAVGFGMGFLVAAQLGPMSLLLIRTVLRGSLAAGLAIAAGVAVVDTLYAAAGAAGAASALSIDSVRTVLGLAGAAVLVALGAHTLWSAFRVRLGGEVPAEVATPKRAFGTALGATASNPLTIASWAALFAAASAGASADSAPEVIALLAGVGIGSLTWMAALAGGVAVARRHVGERLVQGVDLVAGAGLIVFGALLGVRTLREDG